MKQEEIDKKIEGYANTAVLYTLNVARGTITAKSGSIMEHGEEVITLREKWLVKVKGVLHEAYEDAINDGGWWHQTNTSNGISKSTS